MVRQFQGNSVLGSEFNSLSGQTEGTNIKRRNIFYGRIQEISKTKLLARVSLFNKDKTLTKFLKFTYSLDELLAICQIEELKGRVCSVEFYGNGYNSGKIIKIIEENTYDKENLDKMQNLAFKGASYAVPGSGMI